MGIFARMQEEGLTIRDMLLERGILKEYINNLQPSPLDEEDIKNIALIKKVFGNKAVLSPKKIDILKQKDLMYNNSKRFICVLNRNNETGKGYQEYFGFNEFQNEYKKYIRESEKMICFSTLFSKFPTSDGTIRNIENINRISIFIQDLDAGKDGMPIEEQLKRVARLVEEGKILMPNFFIFSGTGIQPVWFTDNLMMKLNSKVYDTWVGIQKAMFTAFEEAGLKPDEAVFQPFHNTRLVDTFNERAGKKLVRGYVLHTERKKLSNFINYYFADLHDVYKKNPTKKERQTSKTGKVVKSPKFWNAHSYAWGIMDDMKRIPVLKDYYNEPLVGLKWRWRMATVVRFFALIYWNGDEDRALLEVENWWNCLTPDQKQGTSLREIIRRSKTAVRYYKEHKEGKASNQKYKRAGLFYKNQTYVDELELSVEIQMQLNIIKIRKYDDKTGTNKTGKKWDTEYERKRNSKRRKEKGIQTREEKKQAKIEAIKKVLEGNPEASVRDISKVTSISVGSVHKYLKEML